MAILKEQIRQWLQAKLQLSGLLACGVSFPDKTYVLEWLAPNVSQESFQNSLRCAEDTFDVANLQKIPAIQLRWVYEKVTYFFVKRTDKTVLGLAISKETEQKQSQYITEMLREFCSL